MEKWKGAVEIMVEKVGIIVSANADTDRWERVIQSIVRQTYTNYGLCVVSDRSHMQTIRSRIERYQDRFLYVDYVEQSWNGQGDAFYKGIQKAADRDYSHVWLLRDSMRVKEDALQKLVEVGRSLSGQYGFLSSVVLCKGELYYKSAPDMRDYDVWSQCRALEQKLFPLQYAAFDGLFVPYTVIRQIGLPARGMKTGYDGYEYTKRIRKKYSGYYVIESQCIHGSKRNLGYDLARETVDHIQLYKYVYRNDLYLARQEDVRRIGFYFFRALRDLGRIVIRSKQRRLNRVWQIMAGTVLGMVFRPRVEKTGREENE